MKLGQKFKHMSQLFENHRNTFLKEYDITSSQMDILDVLSEREEEYASLKDVVEILEIKYPTVSGLVDRLVKKGYITYMQDENDKRARLITFSETGRKLYKESYTYLQKFDQEALNGLDEEEIKQFTTCLDRIEKNIKEREGK